MVNVSEAAKIFVLDTSVILYNHNAINSFDEHDVAIPITVLEELDNFKKGNEIKNFETRQFIRLLDKLAEGSNSLTDWIPLDRDRKLGRLKVIMNGEGSVDAQQVFGKEKGDHRILNAALSLKNEYPEKEVVLVTKDIALRLKAKALDLMSEDYETGKVKDLDTLYTGKRVITDVDPHLIDALYDEQHCHFSEVFDEPPTSNQYLVLKNDKKSVLAYCNPGTETIERVEKKYAYGIKPRNAEQVFAIHALLNPNVQLVTLQGVAGTGKTLLALASAIEQKADYHQIYLARPVVPLSNKDIGYLPGDVNSKLNPYMEPLWDNLEFIKSQYKETGRNYKKLTEMVDQQKLIISPLAYIRGRSISNVFFIVDEAQNLTPHEIKTIITRAGENTKIVFTGDIYQIDTPYLDSQSNGLSYVIDKLKDQPLYAHITLEKGERSDLANLANQLL